MCSRCPPWPFKELNCAGCLPVCGRGCATPFPCRLTPYWHTRSGKPMARQSHCPPRSSRALKGALSPESSLGSESSFGTAQTSAPPKELQETTDGVVRQFPTSAFGESGSKSLILPCPTRNKLDKVSLTVTWDQPRPSFPTPIFGPFPCPQPPTPVRVRDSSVLGQLFPHFSLPDCS